jgi:hypothetical protein
VREVLVDNNTLNQKRVLKGTSNLSIDLDQFEIHILALEIGDREDSIDGDLRELIVGLGNTAR